MPEYILGIDGGASFSRACVLDTNTQKTVWSHSDGPCNVLLSSKNETHSLLKNYAQLVESQRLSLRSVGLCLAGVSDKTIQSKIHKIAQNVWPQQRVHVTHDLNSALFNGIPNGEGIVALCGTGACVFGRHGGQNYKMGGWGHILGDEGSAYNIAHKALRWIIRDFDQKEKLDRLGQAVLDSANIDSLKQLAQYVSSFSKREIAKLSIPVFEAAREGHSGAQEIIHSSAQYLAKNCLQVAQKLNMKHIPLTTAGGVFAHNELFNDYFQEALKQLSISSKIHQPSPNPALGACLWTLYKDQQKPINQRNPVVENSHIIQEEFTLRELDQVNIEKLATEKRNPNTTHLHELTTSDAVKTLIEEDKKIIPALQEAQDSISQLVDLAAQSLSNGGRLIYVGAGTSGRLGILDASECPPTFSSDPDQVLALIAGGPKAVTQAVEGAEDFRDHGAFDLMNIPISEKDLICGIAASGRTPYVWGALEKAREMNATTALIHCNPPFNKSLPFRPQALVSLDSGPESLTGSTRMRAGTLCKMVLNMVSTLAMTKIGKVWSNYMVDVKPTNNKLKARAIYLVSTLNNIDKESAYKRLCQEKWNVKNCLPQAQKC